MIRIVLIVAIIFSIFKEGYSQTKIGVAIPLMNNSENAADKKLGEQMMKGINDALEEYNTANPDKKITIETGDTKRETGAALQVINKLGSDSNIIAIFGPVFSSEIVNNAGAAAFHKIPVITPTATQNFLAEKNEYLFQLNPTYDIRGRLNARYAMNELGMKNFVILSEDTYGKNFADSFADEVTKSGNTIVFAEYYSKDKNDLTGELDEIKNKVFEKEKFIDFGNLNKSQSEKLRKIKYKFSYPDSLINEKLIVSIYKIFGKGADRIVDSLGLSTITSFDKNKNFILGYVDAIYIPISNSTEISVIASQYFSENINLPVLGTSDWNNEKALNENRMYIKELYFDSDFYLKGKSSTDITILSEADIKNYYFGYDGMKLILKEISDGNNTRQSLNEALEKISAYPSEHNGITIKDRTNHQMSMMIFKKGKMEKIKDFVY